MARLTVSVSDETLERLRTLAGGERKVGAMLDSVVTWLWSNYQDSSGRPVAELLDAADATQVAQSVQSVEVQLSHLRSQTDALLAFMIDKMDLSAEDLTTLRRLQAQEDSGNNDA